MPSLPFLLVIIIALTACGAEADKQNSHFNEVTNHDNSDNVDWPLLDLNEQGTRYSTLKKINPSNVDQLGFAWEFTDFVVRGRTHRGVEASPIVVDGVMYFTGPWSVAYAVNAKTGQHLWMYDPKVDGQSARLSCCDAVNRGLAVHNGVVYVASLDGFLIALDAQSGQEIWKVDTFYNRKWNYTITSAPFLAGENIMIGNGGADMGARGYVSAYNLETGKLTWRFWAVPGDPETEPDENSDVTFARTTWPEDTHWEFGLGGNAWGGLTYDRETNTAFLALGNGGPHPAWLRSKSGEITDQLFLTSIVAVNAKTGTMKWYYQTTPGDSWDYAAVSPMVMAELEIDGKPRKVIMQAPKNGIFYVLDRNTGELLRANPFTDVTWTSGIDMKTGRPVVTEAGKYRNSNRIITPGNPGAHSWSPMAYSPKTKLVYFQVNDTTVRYIDLNNAIFKPGTANQGTYNEFPPFNREGDAKLLAGLSKPTFAGKLIAWDPVKAEVSWTVPSPTFLSSGTLVVNDLVFWGNAAGEINTYHAETGKRLFSTNIGTNIFAAPITYQIDGEQYIAIMAGAGGPQGPFYSPDTAAGNYQNQERLMVLKLDGGVIPFPEKLTPPVLNPVLDPITASSEMMEHGQNLFQEQCHRCHLLGGALGMYPNLWNMPPTVAEAFKPILKGAFRYMGMADFSDTLSDKDIAAIKAFIINDSIEKRKNGQNAGAQYRSATH